MKENNFSIFLSRAYSVKRRYIYLDGIFINDLIKWTYSYSKIKNIETVPNFLKLFLVFNYFLVFIYLMHWFEHVPE